MPWTSHTRPAWVAGATVPVAAQPLHIRHQRLDVPWTVVRLLHYFSPRLLKFQSRNHFSLWWPLLALPRFSCPHLCSPPVQGPAVACSLPKPTLSSPLMSKEITWGTLFYGSLSGFVSVVLVRDRSTCSECQGGGASIGNGLLLACSVP
ncbi:hypothetical protein IWX50DRAFT_48252 [Phyllosticta citricarpa]